MKPHLFSALVSAIMKVPTNVGCRRALIVKELRLAGVHPEHSDDIRQISCNHIAIVNNPPDPNCVIGHDSPVFLPAESDNEECGQEYKKGLSAGEKRIRRIYGLLCKTEKRMAFFARCRSDIGHSQRPTDGIIGSKDPWAIKWVHIAMRREWLASKLVGQSPNWFHAYWLNNQEARERNEIEYENWRKQNVE